MIAQKLALDGRFPDSECSIRKGELVWIGFLQPSSLSAKYKIRIQYRLGQKPRIKALEPELEKPEGRSLPHVYRGDYLCVFTPWNNEWRPDLRIADTIVPWTSEWLLHYEFWLVTGNWHGGGTHPDRNYSDTRN